MNNTNNKTSKNANKKNNLFLLADTVDPAFTYAQNNYKFRLLSEKITVYERMQIIKEYSSSNYDIIYNVIKGKYFWRIKNLNKGFKELHDRAENSMIMKIMDHIPKIGNISDKLFKRILESDFIPDHDPFKEYFSHAVYNDDKNIEKLANTITPKKGQEERWKLYFRKWLIASVVSMLGEDINHTCLILSSKQGLGKGKWFEKLALNPAYLHSGPLHPGNKDSKILLSEMQLIYLDELEGITKGEWSKIKSLTTQKTINVKRPYGHRSETLTRRASFCGSLNNPEILNDQTGNRRWLIVEVEKLIINSTMN